MDGFLVLTAAPDGAPPPDDLIAEIADRLKGDVRALDRERAVEIGYEGRAPAGLVEDLRARGDLDANIVVAQHRRKALLVADMDATIVAEETLDEFAAFAGVKEQVAAITTRAMAGDLDFEAALKARVKLLSGLPAARLDDVATRLTINPGARTLVATMKAFGARCVLATGGFVQIAERVAMSCGFDAIAANRFAIEDGRLTGGLAGPIRGPEAKWTTLTDEAAAIGGPARALAVGDGANDAPMLAAAGLGVAYRGKPAAKSAAGAWVDHGDLTALLHLQGYAREDFVIPTTR